MLSKMRNASSVRNNRATKMAGFIIGTVILVNRCHGVAPSTLAALSRLSSTSESPASSSSAMNGVVFHTSARMMIASDGKVSVSGAVPLGRRFARCPLSGVQA